MNESEPHGQQLKEEPAKQRSPKLSSEKSLPRAAADTVIKIIKGYAVASNGGETQVNYKDVASAAGINPTMVSGNNQFLLESEILISPKYGFYLPSESAVRFAREAAWDEAGAKAHLRKIVVGCWYGQVVTQNFTLRSSLTRDELKRSLAIKCGATEGDSNALEFLIDFIIYTGLVGENENGSLSRGNFDEVPKSTSERPAKEFSQPSAGSVEAIPTPALKPTQPAVSLMIHLHIKSFDELTPEHAARLNEWMLTLQEKTRIDGVQIEVKEQ